MPPVETNENSLFVCFCFSTKIVSNLVAGKQTRHHFCDTVYSNGVLNIFMFKSSNVAGP